MTALWTGEFREDWRYAFAVGRLRVLATQMLETSRLNDLANTLNVEELVGRLTGTAYAPGSEGGTLSEHLEARLRHLRWAGYDLVISLCLDEDLQRFLQGPEDFRNVKILLRRSLIENSPELTLSELGFIRPSELEDIFEAEKYDALPGEMANAIGQAIGAYYDLKNPRSIDLAIDRWSLLYRRRLAGELRNEYLLGLCGLLADLGNIRSMARIKWLQEDRKLLEQAYLPGGSIELSRLGSALGSPWETLPSLFFATAYLELVEHGTAGVVADESFVRLEKYCEDYIREFLRATNQVVAGPEPLVGYLLGLEQEIRSIRLIFSAKQVSLDAETIRDRLALSFAG